MSSAPPTDPGSVPATVKAVMFRRIWMRGVTRLTALAVMMVTVFVGFYATRVIATITGHDPDEWGDTHFVVGLGLGVVASVAASFYMERLLTGGRSAGQIVTADHATHVQHPGVPPRADELRSVGILTCGNGPSRRLCA